MVRIDSPEQGTYLSQTNMLPEFGWTIHRLTELLLEEAADDSRGGVGAASRAPGKAALRQRALSRDQSRQRAIAILADQSDNKELGRVLYTDYAYAFEIAAVILLVAIVAAIALTLRHRKETKFQDARTQLAANKDGRLKVIKMPSEAPPPRPEGAQ